MTASVQHHDFVVFRDKRNIRQSKAGHSVERLVRGRVKRIDASIRDRLQALLVRELESEIARLTHELEIARQRGAHLASEQISEIETHLSRASSLLKGADV